MSNFLNYGFDERLIKVLNEIKFTEPTEIQKLAIPQILNKNDIIASAQTGTGKTAAFLLPALHELVTNPPKGKGPHVLILVPTRELAVQIFEEAKRFSKHMPHLKIACIYGGVPYHSQKRALANRCDIVVATPGRLIDHMDQGLVDLSSLKLLILDEADRMLDMGFVAPIEKIAAASPKERQTLLFSATIDKRVLPISKKLLKSPFEIKAAATQMQKNSIEQLLYYVDNMNHKTRILEHLLENTQIYQAILFTSTKRQANVLARHLKDKGYPTAALHGDMNQRQRTRTVESMRRGDIQILVATDVAARGIDISSITHVINFDLPRNPEDFVHRIGRTGRAGATGVAITFATYSEEHLITKTNKLTHTPMKPQVIASLEPKPKGTFKAAGPANHFRPKQANWKSRDARNKTGAKNFNWRNKGPRRKAFDTEKF